MGLPTLIHTEVVSAAALIDFASGGTGQQNNAPLAFNQSGIGTPAAFGPLLLIMQLQMSVTGFLHVNFNAGGFNPDVGAIYDYMNRGFDRNAPAATDAASLTGQTQWVLNPVTTDVTASGQRINVVMQIERKDPPAIENIGGLRGITWEGATNVDAAGNALAHFDGRGNYNIGSVTDGIHITPSAGTLTGRARLYGWPLNT